MEQGIGHGRAVWPAWQALLAGRRELRSLTTQPLYNRGTMSLFARRMLGAFKRTLPDCIAQTQAIAFNMFLALAPTVVLVLGIVAASHELRVGLLDTLRPFRAMLPPGFFQLITDFFNEPSMHAWRLILLGLGGCLIAGGQMMRLVIDGLRMVYKDHERAGYWSRNLRAFLLLAIAIAPWLMTTMLIGFGKQMRARMMGAGEWPPVVVLLWQAFYVVGTLAVVMFVLAVIYRIGRPGAGGFAAVARGAAVAAVLWWFVSWAFGVYMRSVPYRAVYGGLEVAIGLMIWMELTATVILLGAAYNAECAGSA
jgi:membrane protein